MAGWGYDWTQHLDPIWLVSWWAGVPDRDSGVTLLSRSVSDSSSLQISGLDTAGNDPLLQRINIFGQAIWFLIVNYRRYQTWVLPPKWSNTGSVQLHVGQSESSGGLWHANPYSTPLTQFRPVGTLWWTGRLISFTSHRCYSPIDGLIGIGYVALVGDDEMLGNRLEICTLESKYIEHTKWLKKWKQYKTFSDREKIWLLSWQLEMDSFFITTIVRVLVDMLFNSTIFSLTPLDKENYIHLYIV